MCWQGELLLELMMFQLPTLHSTGLNSGWGGSTETAITDDSVRVAQPVSQGHPGICC
jgi:hypothetical protein